MPGFRAAIDIPASVDEPSWVITVEHARMDRPDSGFDGHDGVVASHWGWDPGAEAVARAVAVLTGWPVVLAGFSRLLADPNRAPQSPELSRREADGYPIQWNAPTALGTVPGPDRMTSFYEPFHACVHAMLQRHPSAGILSIHSFTPVYLGKPRTLDIGVLFDHDEALAVNMLEQLQAAAPEAQIAYNEPYSGKNGLMYSPHLHATRSGRPAVELEIRQDLATDHTTRCMWSRHIAAAAVWSAARLPSMRRQRQT